MKNLFLSVIMSMITIISYCQQKNNYQVHNIKGDEYLKNGDTINAIKEYTKTLLTSPKNYYALRKCGILNFSIKNFEGAEKDLTTCISIKKTDAEVFYKRGLSHQEILGDPRSMRMKSGDFLTGGMSLDTTVNAEWRAIINDYKIAVQINPQLIDAYIQSAYIKNARSYFNYLGSPLDDYNAAIKIQPGNSTVLKLIEEYESNQKN